MDIFYTVNAKIPNDKAHGIQIVKTCEALGQGGNTVYLVLAGKARDNRDLFEFYGIANSFKIVRLPVIDTPLFGPVLQFTVRSFTFYVCMYPYIMWNLVRNFFRGVHSIIYVRGEAILALAPVFFFSHLVWESHTLRGHKRLYLTILPLLSGVVVITEKYKRDLVATGRIDISKIVCARDAVDIKEFDISRTQIEARTKLALPHDKTIVLYTGQLAAHKGVDTLLASGALLPDEYLILVVGGKEADITRYKKMFKSQNSMYVGLVPHNQIPLYLKAADVLVLPDSAESEYGRLHTSPMKMFEYMASKKPIVASNVPSLREVLNEKNAIMFIPDNAKDLATRILYAQADVARSTQVALRAYDTVQQFSWKKRAQIIGTFITETS